MIEALSLLAVTALFATLHPTPEQRRRARLVRRLSGTRRGR